MPKESLNKNALRNLMCQQAYRDTYHAYLESLTEPDEPVWDYVILTASSEEQAQIYNTEIRSRLEKGYLPRATRFVTIPDPKGERVGSGGATLSAIRHVLSEDGTLTGKKILVIHSGGDSRRVPQYSACGKLFSPVPRELQDGRASSLFDEFMIGMTGIPARMPEGGMLVCSGDVLLLFNYLQLEFFGEDAVALSIKEPAETGSHHGVFLTDKDRQVRRFLHKLSVEDLTAAGAVDENGDVDIDTGAVLLHTRVLEALAGLISNPAAYDHYVNSRSRLSFYGDFLYPMASEATLSDYLKEAPEGELCPELSSCRKQLFRTLSGFRLQVCRFSPASFVHFGTTAELRRLMCDEIADYAPLDWKRAVDTNSPCADYTACNAYISTRAHIKPGAYIEHSCIHRGSVVESGAIVSCITLNGQHIPADTVVHGLRLANGKFTVRMYGVNDNPKLCTHMGKELDQPLWTAPLFPVADSTDEALDCLLRGKAAQQTISLADSFRQADLSAQHDWHRQVEETVRLRRFLDALECKAPTTVTSSLFPYTLADPESTYRRLEEMANQHAADPLSDLLSRLRLYYHLSQVGDRRHRDAYQDRTFDTLRESLLHASLADIRYREDLRIATDSCSVELPVRINFGGGWSDTPPYCNENGGYVLNAAITMNGKCPVHVQVSKMGRMCIALTSSDNGSYREFTSLSALRDCRSPHDPFALHKASLLAMGVIPMTDDGCDLQTLLTRLGGGFRLATSVTDIPRGSGLGTSSILAAACMSALHRFFGIEATWQQLSNKVLCMEQLMSTGGGWQDQIGGLLPGIKAISSAPGLRQQLQVEELRLTPEMQACLNRRFVAIFTGQRRLARNLLREVIGRYLGGNPDTLYALDRIQKVAKQMRDALTNQDPDTFGDLMNRHWVLSKMIDENCTNAVVETIFEAIDDLIAGRMICGAGGGGFLQVLLREDVSYKQLQKRLAEVFPQSDIRARKIAFLF